MSTDAIAGLRSRALQLPIALVALGHGATHWISATFYLLLPSIVADLGLSYAQAGLLVTCFHVGSTAANLPSGSLVDLTGRRVLIQAAALVIGSVALFALGLVELYVVLCVWVVIIGASNMMWHPAAIAYLSGTFPANRGYALSIHALGANLGDAVAPLVAGLLLLGLSWQATAEINAIAGVAAALALVAVLGRSDAAAVAAAKAVSLRVYLANAVAVLRTRAVWSLCLMAGFRTMMQNGLLMFLPLYLANEMGLNPFWMGVALMVLQLGGVVAAPVAGVVSDRIGRRPVVLAGMGATTVLIVALTFVSNATAYVAGVAVLGFCVYALRPVVHSWLMDRSPPELAATMTSTMFGVQAGLSTLAPLIGGALADAFGLVSVFYFLAATMLVANLLALAVPKSERGD